MEDGPPIFKQDNTCPVLLDFTHHLFSLTGLSPSMVELSRTLPIHFHSDYVVLQPHECRNTRGLGCSPFARRYSGNHYCFLFLRLLRCFSSPGLPPTEVEYLVLPRRVTPFGNLYLKDDLHLSTAYRSLSRPSSLLGAKASTNCSYLLINIITLSIYQRTSHPKLLTI